MVRNYTACANMLFDKDIMIKRQMDICVEQSDSPLFVYLRRMQKQWELISKDICNVWSVKYFKDNFTKNSNKKCC